MFATYFCLHCRLEGYTIIFDIEEYDKVFVRRVV